MRGAESDRLSILASVESPERELFAPARSRVRWPWIALLVLSVGTAAAYVWQPSIGPSLAQWAAEPSLVESPPVTNSSASPMAASASEPTNAEATRAVALLTEPARIETMAVSAQAVPADPFVALDLAASAGTVVAAPASAPAPAASAVETAAKKPTTKSAASKRKPRVAAASPSKSNARKVAASKKANPSKDADADLLAALMAHMSSQGGAGHAAAPRNSTKPMDQPTIAKLVKRCESLKGEEAVQCRRRICDGYWGKAQACPVQSAESGK